MLEYGYLYFDPQIGRFRSRLSLEALRRQDRERAEEVAAILDRFYEPSTYPSFLDAYTPITDAFAHEARVHLFRRNRFLRRAKTYQHDAERRRKLYTVAYREHQIMDTYFHQTFRRSKYGLPPKQINLLKQHDLPDQVYDSSVSRHLMTRLSERQVISVLFLLLIGLGIVDRYGGQERTQRREKR